MLARIIDDGVATLTLQRAERGNALSPELVSELAEGVERACADPSIHTLLLRADGPNFCTGFDLSDLDSCSEGDLLARFVRIEELLASIWHAPIRTVAIAQGRAWGAGADLFAVCELRIATADATFRFPGAGFGLVLGSRRLSERVGADRARQWVTGGAQVDAAEALSTGLATAVVDTLDWSPQDVCPAPAVSRETAAAIRRATRADHRDADLAALVRSAAAPGLKARIAAYREALRGATRKASPPPLTER